MNGHQNLYYEESCKLTFSCIFQLSSFPFDSHECYLYIGSYEDYSSILTLNPLEIMYDDMGTSINGTAIIPKKLHQPKAFKQQVRCNQKGL